MLREKFKPGQDFEYVKYRLSKALGLEGEEISLTLNGKAIIPIYSICDVEMSKDDVILFKINK